MTDKQKEALELITKYFNETNNYEVDTATLNQWKGTKVQGSVLSNLAIQGYLTRTPKGKSYIYSLPVVEITEEEKLKREYKSKLSDIDGMARHLSNSLQSWETQCSYTGIEFPHKEWDEFSKKMDGLISSQYNKVLKEYKDLTNSDLLEEQGAF